MKTFNTRKKSKRRFLNKAQRLYLQKAVSECPEQIKREVMTSDELKDIVQ